MQLNHFLTSFSAMEYLQKLQYDNTTCQPMPKRIPGEDYVKYIGKTVFCQRIFRLFPIQTLVKKNYFQINTQNNP